MILSEIENATVKSVWIGREDHGILTAFVYLDGAAWSQGFGGYDLRYDNRLAQFVEKATRAVGVEHWGELVGKPCRIRRHEGLIVSLGNFITNEWFTPKRDVLWGDK